MKLNLRLLLKPVLAIAGVMCFFSSTNTYSQAQITVDSITVYKAIFFQKSMDSTYLTLCDFSCVAFPDSKITKVEPFEVKCTLKNGSSMTGKITSIKSDKISFDLYKSVITIDRNEIASIFLNLPEKEFSTATLGVAGCKTTYSSLFFRQTSPNHLGFMFYAGFKPDNNNDFSLGGIGGDLLYTIAMEKYTDFSFYLGSGVSRPATATNLFISSGLSIRISKAYIKFGYVLENKPKNDNTLSKYTEIFFGWGWNI